MEEGGTTALSILLLVTFVGLGSCLQRKQKDLRLPYQIASPQCPMQSAPDDCLLKVLAFLDPCDIVSAYVPTCKRSMRLSDDPFLWKKLTIQRFNGLLGRWNLGVDLATALTGKLSAGTTLLDLPDVPYNGWSMDAYFRLCLGWRELLARAALHVPRTTATADDGSLHSKAAPPVLILTVVRGQLLDVTGFLRQHPGSPEILLSVAGCDGTREFETATNHSNFALSMVPMFAFDHGALALKHRRKTFGQVTGYQGRTTTLGFEEGDNTDTDDGEDDDNLDECGSGGFEKCHATSRGVPQHALVAWRDIPCCLDVRSASKRSCDGTQRVNYGVSARKEKIRTSTFSSKTPTLLPSSIVYPDEPKAVDTTACPHCGLSCREEAIFAEWAPVLSRGIL